MILNNNYILQCIKKEFTKVEMLKGAKKVNCKLRKLNKLVLKV